MKDFFNFFKCGNGILHGSKLLNTIQKLSFIYPQIVDGWQLVVGSFIPEFSNSRIPEFSRHFNDRNNHLFHTHSAMLETIAIIICEIIIIVRIAKKAIPFGKNKR